MKTYTEEKRIRPDILTGAVYWSVIIVMVYNIFSVRIFGEKGAGFSAGPLSLYFILYVAFILSVQKAVYVMVRLRTRRSQFINAESNMKKSLRIFSIVGILLSVILMFCSYVVAKNLLGSARSYFQVIIVAVSLLFMCPQGVFRGYLQGLGYTKPILVGDLLISITSFATGAVISGILYNYGKKVNDLFHVDEYSAIYGASGMMMGLLIGTIVGFIHIMIAMMIRKNEIANIVKNGAPRYLDNKNDVLTGLKHILYLYASPVLMCFLDYVIYILTCIRKEQWQDMAQNLGIYSGRIVSVVIVLTFLCCIPFIKSWNRIMARIERDEYEGARERLKTYIRYSFMLFIPVTFFVFSIAGTIQVALFGKSNDMIDGLAQLSALIIFFLAANVFCSWILSHMGNSIAIALDLSVAWLVHVGCMALFVVVLNKGLTGLLAAQLIPMVVYLCMSTTMLFRSLRYRMNVLRVVLMPLLASGIAGLIIYVINLLLVNLIGDILTLILSVLVYFVVYMLLMIVLGAIRAHELQNMPFGRIFGRFANSVQHDRYYEE